MSGRFGRTVLILILAAGARVAAMAAESGPILDAAEFRGRVEAFNRGDDEVYEGHVPNAAAWAFLEANAPLLDCPDEQIEGTFCFRWWTYRKHVKQTPAGFIIDEFLPNVSWAGKFNTIDCAAGHHLYEGRWLRDPRYLDDYSRFWFHGGGEPRRYSFWAADAILARARASGDMRLPIELLPDLVANHAAWERTHRDPNGLYWQIDDRDGMEASVGGSGYRATINSYQYGDAIAIARIAEAAGQPDIAAAHLAKAEAIKRLVQERLWDDDAKFFKVVPRGGDKPVDVRELHGYTPWYFHLPDPPLAVAWKQLMDPEGFFAPFGPTTAERRHPGFRIAYAGHECQWNGPSWPFATSVTLTAAANLLNGPPQDAFTAADYVRLLKIYAASHTLQRPGGEPLPWIDENLNPDTGDWISRTLLIQRKQPPRERGKDYNHSTFCDLVVTGLVGLRPRADDVVEVNPLVPPSWDWFCLDRIPYHGRLLTIAYDRDGTRYGRGRGLFVLVDGTRVTAADAVGRITGQLPPRPGR